MLFLVEALRGDWHIVEPTVPAPSEPRAIAQVSEGPDLYRIGADTEPERHYYFVTPDGRIEPMDR